jgi:hypothetical protein
MDFSVDSLKANLTNPQRSYLFDVLIPVPVGGGDSNTLQIRAEASEIPSVGNDPIGIAYKATAGIQVAGKKVYDHKWTCTFREGEDHRIYDALYAWCQNITNDVLGIGVGDPFYKTDAYISLLKVDGSTSMRLKLKGCWISNIGKYALSYTDSKIVTYSVEFTFDSFEYQPQ